MAHHPKDQEQDHDGITMNREDEEVVGDEEGDRLLPANVFDGVNIEGHGQQLPSLVTWEFPPPLTLLDRKDDHCFEMPLVFRRSTDGNRLVVTIHRLRRQEFLVAHRSDGRLRLNFAYLVDTTASTPPQEPGSSQDSPDETDVAGAAPALPSAAAAAGGDLDGATHRSGVEISDEKGELGDEMAADAWSGTEPGKNVTSMAFTPGACSITSSILHLHMPTMGPIHS